MEDNNKNMNVFEYVTIPLAEYKALIKKVQKLKAKVLVAEAEAAEERSRRYAADGKYDDAIKMIEKYIKELEDAES